MSHQHLLVSDQAAVRTITLNRPDKLNALNRETLTELHIAFDQAEAESSIRVVVLTGAGPKAFVAGADISELAVLTPVQARDFSRYGQALMRKIERFPKPVIAAINGFALGGGFELAMGCHLRIASTNAKIGQPEINLGVIPGFGGTQRLTRLAGRAAALELCLGGAPVNAERAHQLGLVNRLVEPDALATEVAALANQLAGSAPHALRGVLDAVMCGEDCSLDAGLEFETQVFALLVSTTDMREGTRAFLEKRKPNFVGE